MASPGGSIREVPAAEWDKAVLEVADASLLQSAAWGELKSRWGWTPRRLAWDPRADGAACAQVLVRPLGFPGYGFGYVAHGPVATGTDVELWVRWLSDLETWARGARLGVLKVELDLAEDSPVRAALIAAGWRPSHEAIQFRNTMLSPLDAPERLLAAMKSKTRYNVQLAERRGVEVTGDERAIGEPLNPSDVDAFFDLYAETASRDGFAIRHRAYYADAMRSLALAQPGCLLMARHEGRLLAGAFIATFGPTAFYLYGASSTEGREHMPSSLVLWRALLWARGAGCRTFDWWGGPDVAEPSDPMWGVYRFKSGFGAALDRRLGAWDKPVAAVPYAAYRRLTGLRRRILRGPLKLGLERLFG